VGQPTITVVGGRGVAKFGSGTLPNGQGAMTVIDLNDGTYTRVRGINVDGSARQLTLAQLLFRGRGVYLSDDSGPGIYAVPMVYLEDATHFIGGLLAALESAGEQPLTFDNATTNLVQYRGITNRKPAIPKVPMGWEFDLELVAKSSYWNDLAATTMAPLTLVTDTGQGFNITYAGSIYAEPVWTLVIPAGNGVAINSFTLRNTMSLEFLTVNFQSVLAIPAATDRTITIDSAASTAIDNLGNQYDTVGTFPKLYPAVTQPPTGQVNPFTAIVVPASGSSAGLTLACSHYPRWKL
jgi:hypothetical protein